MAIVPEQFHELRVRTGDLFSVESVSPPKRYPVRLLGFNEGLSLIVSAPSIQGKSFLLPEGQVLRVRLMAGNVACGFQTQVLKNNRVPYLYSHLKYPAKVSSVAVRQASRVELKLPVRIEEFESGELPGEWPKKAMFIDLSSGGGRLHTEQPIAAVGSELKLTFKVVIDGVERASQIKAIVRNITEVGASPDQAALQYGVQFLDVSDNDRVHISGYVYEQIIDQSGS
ncbi:MAG: flagellar brake protein [Halopseudomonas sp.]